MFINIDILAQTGHYEMLIPLLNIIKNGYIQFFSSEMQSLFHFLSTQQKHSQVITIPPLLFEVIKELLQEHFSRLRRKE